MEDFALGHSLLTERVDPKFYEPRAVVLNKMGQHKQALEIYVFKLQDSEKAEEYEARTIHSTAIAHFILVTVIKCS